MTSTDGTSPKDEPIWWPRLMIIVASTRPGRVGLPIAVPNAVAEVRAVASVVTRAAGGHGAVREIAEAILKARGVWSDLLERYFTEAAPRAR